MKEIFLESHNIKNLYFGFGQFNYHLIKAFWEAQDPEFRFTVNTSDKKALKNEFGDFFKYHQYRSLSRYSLFRNIKKYNLWHSLNQNTKVEPGRKMPYLMTVHDIHFVEEQATDDARKKRFIEKLNRCNAVVYISEFAKKSTHEHFDVPQIPEYMIYNGNPVKNDALEAHFKPKIISSKPFLFNIGEMTPRKNAHTLVEMLQFLPDFDLFLAGNTKNSYTEKVIQSIEKYNLQERVHILGKISEEDKKYYLKNCAAFVFPSLREGFGIPPIEAMTYGKPVFMSNFTSLPEIGGDHAYYWDHFDPEHMASILHNGLQEYSENLEQNSNNIKQYAKRFSWEQTAAQYLQVYKQILS